MAPPFQALPLWSPSFLSCPCESGYFWKSLWAVTECSLGWGVLDGTGPTSYLPTTLRKRSPTLPRLTSLRLVVIGASFPETLQGADTGQDDEGQRKKKNLEKAKGHLGCGDTKGGAQGQHEQRAVGVIGDGKVGMVGNGV